MVKNKSSFIKTMYIHTYIHTCSIIIAVATICAKNSFNPLIYTHMNK